MSIILIIAAIYGLSVVIRDIDGPFNIISWARHKLLTNSLIGVFFYQLLSCPVCIGFHTGYLIYLLSNSNPDLKHFIIYGLAGSAITLIVDEVRSKLNS